MKRNLFIQPTLTVLKPWACGEVDARALSRGGGMG